MITIVIYWSLEIIFEEFHKGITYKSYELLI